MLEIEELAKMEEGEGGFRSSPYHSSPIASTRGNEEARVLKIEELAKMEEGRACVPENESCLIADHVASIVCKINSIRDKEATWVRDGAIPKRRTNLEARYFSQQQIYRPVCVSIGPYYHGDSKLGDMENVKWRCLKFLTNTTLPTDILQSNIQECLRELKNKEEDVRKLYDEITISKKRFVEMLLLDACFIISFILSHNKPHFWLPDIPHIFTNVPSTKNPLLEDMLMADMIRQDLLMTENQIPSGVVVVIWRWLQRTKVIQESSDLNDGMYIFFTRSLYPSIITLYSGPFGTSFSHVLHQFHHYICHHQSDNYNEDVICTWIPSVTQLEKAGVKFKRKRVATSFLDITFNGGVLEIPQLPTRQLWRFILRNLMDFENGVEREETIVRGYVVLMCYLLKTSNDARILGQASVIHSADGIEEDIPKFFVELWSQECGNGIYQFPCTLFVDIDKYYRSRRNLWTAVLKRNYRDNPWFILSTIVAAILLLATLIGLGYQIDSG